MISDAVLDAKALRDALRKMRGWELGEDGRIAKAQGEAVGFKELLEGYENSKVVTRQRLYLEAMEEILPGVTKIILAEDISSGLLPFLPLTGGGAGPIVPAAAAGGTN